MKTFGWSRILIACCLTGLLLGCAAEPSLREGPDAALAKRPSSDPLEPVAPHGKGPGGAASAVQTPSQAPSRVVDVHEPPPSIVRAMLELASVAAGETVHVLGCGDGAIPIGAARDRGSRVVVIDEDAPAIAVARENVRIAGVESMVEFREEDLSTAPIGDARVILVDLSPALAREIQKRLGTDVLPGTRVVSWTSALTALGADGGYESGSLSLFRVPGGSHPDSLAPFVPTPMPVVRRMLEMADCTEDDVVYDLGCGDGRIVIEAAKSFGCRAVGVDFDLRRIEEARENARREGVESLVEFRQEDIFEADISDATVVTLYLLPDSNNRLKAKLSALRPGARVVSHQFETEGWTPTLEETLTLPAGGSHRIYLWVVRDGGVVGGAR